jgi:enamine deaminase RidA (YjgF/YER057c/UK114 family)
MTDEPDEPTPAAAPKPADEPTPIQPEGWTAPRGYSNGTLAPAGSRLLAIAGQIAWDADQHLVSPDFLPQFRQALENVVAVVRSAGGDPRHLISVTVYVTDKRQYLADTRALGTTWREVCGRHYPAMALVEVADLLEEGALVEIQALAALPPPG